MAEADVIQFLFVTLYGNGIKGEFCPYAKCTGSYGKWNPQIWKGQELARLVSIANVIRAIYGQNDCVKAEFEPDGAAWVADLRRLFTDSGEQQKLEADLEKLRDPKQKIDFGGDLQTVIAAGCNLSPQKIYDQVKG
jgi:hypothetical protein